MKQILKMTSILGLILTSTAALADTISVPCPANCGRHFEEVPEGFTMIQPSHMVQLKANTVVQKNSSIFFELRCEYKSTSLVNFRCTVKKDAPAGYTCAPAAVALQGFTCTK